MFTTKEMIMLKIRGGGTLRGQAGRFWFCSQLLAAVIQRLDQTVQLDLTGNKLLGGFRGGEIF